MTIKGLEDTYKLMKDISDWRVDIRKIESLYDIDGMQLLIFLRHNYIEIAKDYLKHEAEACSDSPESMLEAIEGIQAAIDAQWKPMSEVALTKTFEEVFDR